MKKIKLYMLSLGVLMMTSMSSCGDYLDVVPDNVATIENAFSLRETTEKFLFTCYSYRPVEHHAPTSLAFMGADELWTVPGGAWDEHMFSWDPAFYPFRVATNQQNVEAPYCNFWDGTYGGKPLWRAIRECNIFLENANRAPDMDDYERNQWIDEVKFLKAYYHFLLLRQYGPIPITDTNIDVSSDVADVKVYRDPVDDCFDYIVSLMEEVEKNEYILPLIIEQETEKGRVDMCVVKAMKAMVLVYAASPLFNGNTDYVTFLDPRTNEPLFNQEYDENKWVKAAEAANDAVAYCESKGFKLHEFIDPTGGTLSPTSMHQLSYREAFTQRKDNTEGIWINTASTMGGANYAQAAAIPRDLYKKGGGNFSIPMNIVEKFYSSNGVPIEEDKAWGYANRFNLVDVTDEHDGVNLIQNYTTCNMNIDREDRFYASLSFDGGKYMSKGNGCGFAEAKQGQMKMKKGDLHGIKVSYNYVFSGYAPKKLASIETEFNADNMTTVWYDWPTMRLANLYLLAAEANNEAYGPCDSAFLMIDNVRKRVGLPGVEEAWTKYSTKPQKIESKEGLREIIQQERTIELIFEGQRYWDVRRWKTAPMELNHTIVGYNSLEEQEELYYTPIVYDDIKFLQRDYFTPIREYSLLINKNLLQAPGW